MAGFVVRFLNTGFFKVALPVVALLLLWRFWMFTVRPKIWPNEPRYIPYWIPFLGHFYSFFFDCHQLIDDSVKHLGHLNEPYAFKMCGMTIYCLCHPEHVTGILDGVPWTHGMDFTHIISDVMEKFGMSREDVRRAEHVPEPGDDCYVENDTHNPKHFSLVHFVEDLYNKQYLQPAHLNVLCKAFVRSMQERLQIENLDFCTTEYNGGYYHSENPQIRREVSLYSLVTGTMIDATVKALFGPYLHQVEPDIANQLNKFNIHAWILFYGMPDFFGLSPLCEPRERIKAALRSFIRMPEDQRSEQRFALKALLRQMEVFKLGEDSRVGLLFLFFFANIANEQNACFWFMSHIIYDRGLLEIAKKEIEPAWESGELDVKYLTSNCPTIDAIFNETLRLRVNTFGWRLIQEKMTIGGKELQAGVPVMVPMRLLHNNEKVWGPTVDHFDPTRFLRQKSLTRQPGFRPFAGGPTYCPGRVIAKQETYAFLATLLHRYDVELLPAAGRFIHRRQPFPAMEVCRPPTGVKGPLPGMDLFVGLELKK